MLDKVADINATDNYGESIAHAVAKKNDASLFGLLLQHKQVNLNIANFQGHSPLTSAAMMNKSTSAAILVQHGAQVSHKTNAGLTAFLLAVQRNAVETAAVLLKKAAKTLHTRDSTGNNACIVLIDATSPTYYSTGQQNHGFYLDHPPAQPDASLKDRGCFNRICTSSSTALHQQHRCTAILFSQSSAAGKIRRTTCFIYSTTLIHHTPKMLTARSEI